MNAQHQRHIEAGTDFEQYFQPSPVRTKVMNKWATTENTVQLCLAVAAEGAPGIKALAERFRRPTLRGTCEALWQWVYTHIAYEKDDPGHEQIRYPNRSWRDRRRGVDCDDYAVFIGSVLTALSIPFQLRVTAYQGGWQHIYPVVPISGDRLAKLDQARRGDYIVVDDVTDQFDYEVPYTKHFDTPMQLEALSGLVSADWTDPANTSTMHMQDEAGNTYIPVSGLAGYDPDADYYVDGLGNIFQKIGGAISQAAKFVGNKVASAAKDVANTAKTVVTTPIRLGILAYMKLNFGDKAGMLRWGYLTYGAVAAKAGIGPETHKRMVEALGNLRARFTGMGGDANTLRMAILTGNGNRDRLVPSDSNDLKGLAGLLHADADWRALEKIEFAHSSLRGIEGLQGLGALGEPISATVIIGAAMTVLTSIIKLMGNAQPNDPADPIPAEYQEPEQTDEDYLDTVANEESTDSGDLGDFLGAAIIQKHKITQKKKPLPVAKAGAKPGVKAGAKPGPVVVKKPIKTPTGVKSVTKVLQPLRVKAAPGHPMKALSINTKTRPGQPIQTLRTTTPVHAPDAMAELLKKVVVAVPAATYVPAPKGWSAMANQARVRTPLDPERIATTVEQGSRVVVAASGAIRQVRQDVKAGNQLPAQRKLPTGVSADGGQEAEADAYIDPMVIDTRMPEDGNKGINPYTNLGPPPDTGGDNNTLLLIGGALLLGLLVTAGGTMKPTQARRPQLSGAPATGKKRPVTYQLVEPT